MFLRAAWEARHGWRVLVPSVQRRQHGAAQRLRIVRGARSVTSGDLAVAETLPVLAMPFCQRLCHARRGGYEAPSFQCGFPLVVGHTERTPINLHHVKPISCDERKEVLVQPTQLLARPFK